jgi:hypothetical protein
MDCFSIVEVFTNYLLVIYLYNSKNTYNNTSCEMRELLLHNKFQYLENFLQYPVTSAI